jgi:hypothetical protein
VSGVENVSTIRKCAEGEVGGGTEGGESSRERREIIERGGEEGGESEQAREIGQIHVRKKEGRERERGTTATYFDSGWIQR